MNLTNPLALEIKPHIDISVAKILSLFLNFLKNGGLYS